MSASEAVKETVKGLSASPALLLVAVINMAALLGVGYVAQQQRDERREMRAKDDKLIEMLTARCTDAHP